MRLRESELHQRFQEYNTTGEWFSLTPEISDYIENYAESGEDILRQDRHTSGDREYRKHNREKNLERKRKYREQNREKIRERDREYRQRPEIRERKRQVNKRRCRAKKRVANQQITLNFD